MAGEVFNPEPYQKDGVAWLLRKPFSGLIMRPGTGKTAVVLAARVVLKKKRLATRLLVVAPLRVAKLVWVEEVVKWNFPLTIDFAYGARFEDVIKDIKLDVVTMTVDGWLRLRNTFTPHDIEKLFDQVVFDESTKFKHKRSKRFKAAKEYLPAFARRTILTGTPAPNGYTDLWAQAFLVDRGHRLGKYMSHFLMGYFDRVGFGGFTYVLQQGAAKKIHQKLGDIFYYVDDSKLGLTPWRPNTIPVELDKKTRQLYAVMASEMLIEIKGAKSIAVNAAILSGKLRQIANGGLYTTGHVPTVIHHEKTEAAQDLVEQLQGDPVVIAYEFDHDLARLLKAFGRKTPFIKGGMGLNKTKQLLDTFNKGETPVLICQYQTVAHGLNSLQKVCRTICFYSIPWDLELYEQLIKRVHRKGQERQVVIHHIVAENTVDEVVMRALKRKDKTQRSLLAALLKHVKEEL